MKKSKIEKDLLAALEIAHRGSGSPDCIIMAEEDAITWYKMAFNCSHEQAKAWVDSLREEQSSKERKR